MSRRWRQDDVELLSGFVRNGGDLSTAAAMLWRRKVDVLAKASELKAAGIKGPGERKCLGCSRTFSSRGAHNRLCSECRRLAS